LIPMRFGVVTVDCYLWPIDIARVLPQSSRLARQE
jgi:hypothetical protein